MSEIVDVEIKTFELLFFMLKGDIIKLEVAKKRKKPLEVQYFTEKIITAFEKIDKIKRMIGEIFKNRYENKEVEKTSGGPRNFIDKFNKEKGVVMKMLQSLKGKEFELDMHKIGFEAYDTIVPDEDN